MMLLQMILDHQQEHDVVVFAGVVKEDHQQEHDVVVVVGESGLPGAGDH